MTIKTHNATESDVGTRLDSFIAEHFNELSRAAAAKLIAEGKATVNGKPAAKNYRLSNKDEIAVEFDVPGEIKAVAQNIPIDIVYEDNDIIVINKKKGMVVHPAPGTPDGTLVNALLYHCKDSLSGIGGELRPGIVHRIDKDTGGLLVVAKNDAAHRSLAGQLETHAMYREYRALVHGGFSADEGTIDLPIGRNPSDRKKMAVIRDEKKRSREAVTHYRVLERFGKISYLSLKLETGRTHQIRVHMAYTGHPLLGDEVYGKADSRFEREHASLISGQCLQAVTLTLTHPRTNEKMTFSSPLPTEFEKLLAILRR